MNRPIGRTWRWLVLGGEAGFASVAAALVGHLAFGLPTVINALADMTIRLLPGAATGLVIDEFQHWAKPLLLVGSVAIQLLASALIGLAAGVWFTRRPASHRRLAIGATASASFHAVLALLVIAWAGQLDAATATSPSSALLGWGLVVASSAVYGAAFASLAWFSLGALAVQPNRLSVDHDHLTRRRLLGQALAALGVLITSGSLARIVRGITAPDVSDAVATAEPWLVLQLTPLPAESAVGAQTPSRQLSETIPSAVGTPTTAATSVIPTDTPVHVSAPATSVALPTTNAKGSDSSPLVSTTTPATPTPAPGSVPSPPAASPTSTAVPAGLTYPTGISPLVTPPDQFYVVSKNFVDPVVDVGTWSLEIGGLVDRPLRLSFRDLLALPRVSRYVTLECISNVVGGSQISNGWWTGVPLTTLLARAGIKPGATAINFTSVDNYTESLPLDQGLDGVTMLAHALDGQLLAPKHGAPARLISWNRYGMKNSKWIYKIELAAQSAGGYWEAQGWDAAAIPRTMSRIDVPRTGTVPVGRIVLAGGIAYAGTRGIARVEVSTDEGKSWGAARLEAALAPSTWQRWVYAWRPATPGPVTVLARATDETGTIQSEVATWTFPRGADGYATKLVSVI